MYMLTTALVYNRNLVKPGEAPKTYQDLLDPKWKGKMMFDPEAAFIMAAMEQVWGKEKARDYLARLAKQDLIFRRGTTLTSQLIAAGAPHRDRRQCRNHRGDARQRRAARFQRAAAADHQAQRILRRQEGAAPACRAAVYGLVFVGGRAKGSRGGFGKRGRDERHTGKV
jgi:hypothetical protein